MNDVTDPNAYEAAPQRIRPVKPALRFEEGTAGNAHRLIWNHEGALAEVFGTEDDVLALALLRHCLRSQPVAKPGEPEPEDERPFMLSAVHDIAPRDGVERLLAVQMAVTHAALIRSSSSLARVDTLQRLEAHTTAYNKLARTFAAQVEALRKHRSGGKQTVLVQHVNVADGGQAIVGQVTRGEGGPQ